jgi:hypothetical protein
MISTAKTKIIAFQREESIHNKICAYNRTADVGLWVVMSCGFVGRYECFKETMEAVCRSETLLCRDNFAQHYYPEYQQ